MTQHLPEILAVFFKCCLKRLGNGKILEPEVGFAVMTTYVEGCKNSPGQRLCGKSGGGGADGYTVPKIVTGRRVLT
ncbi:MAG: hypothetical protein EB120_12900 [Proteobacteria bacterium]|nr:hypothetical protein [Pseudomonadota bacterium]NDG28056.1 hypothetical protein [Pseudomonadota bacterium]